MDVVLHIVSHAVEDTLKLLPFLFVTYLAMEALESRAGDRAARAVERAGAAGPVFGGLLGAVPQCGFSAAAATLWSGRVVTAGTLLAVFLSTGDELLPVFLAEGAPLSQLVVVLAVKAVIAIVAGFALDAALRLLHRMGDGHIHVHELCEREHCGCEGEEHGGWLSVVRSALVHTVQVAVFIFLLTLAVGAVVELLGEDAIGSFVASNPVLSVFTAALVGLIPNCAASVVIAELFLQGTLGSAALLAGSLASAGVGLLVLFRTNANLVQNLLLVVALYAIGVVCGLVMLASGLSF